MYHQVFSPPSYFFSFVIFFALLNIHSNFCLDFHLTLLPSPFLSFLLTFFLLFFSLSHFILAGIKINDVILKINDNEIIGSETAIGEFISVIRSSPNTEITLEVYKNVNNLNSKEIEVLRTENKIIGEKIKLTPVEGKFIFTFIFH